MHLHDTTVVLIVDDIPANLEVLSDALTDAGFEVAVATNGESALKQVEYNIPTLILLDVMMPGIDGFETCRRLKANANTKDIPIIFMTALSDSVDKVRGLSLGAVDYITKPFQQAEVLARVQVHVQLRNATIAMEQQNIHLKQENEQRIAAETALQHLTQDLEQRVVERTEELAHTLQILQKAQVQLVQAEKLATLGQLVAGIAHEINNPINFIYANIHHANHYIHDLLKLIQLYLVQYPHPTKDIEKSIKEIDLYFLIEDLPKLLSSMEMGAQRISNIVKSFRNFSRHDESELKIVDIHEGIDSTLNILEYRLKEKVNNQSINIVKKYGSLPQVECCAGKMNQVFMNILSNAIDALEELIINDKYFIFPTILIHTEVLEAEYVVIRIIDNGLGISEEAQKRLFDPFFTTKPAGKGTGLGLSISYQIVEEQHGGSLTCISNPGQGAEFVIKIPIRHLAQSQKVLCSNSSIGNPFY
ncbi:response regulator [Nostoc sp. ChiVER01]|uniref:hybrid sensor histidine kinase/response regulator n=1 Tax=Nostoc sp. ChiVER01 TaxID=3075382 RepID=UPI002AD2966C|nr:response regulator [Nostoc sp. ChiVER01]MDZ8221820.1 response regulator [Nostoc sp. ChiVER01]